jgi:hypothetical protein
MLLIVKGFQVPTIPFGEVVFKAGADVPVHNVKVVSKSGTMLSVMVTTKVIGEAHWFAFGVKI